MLYLGARMEVCLRLAGGLGSNLWWDPAMPPDPPRDPPDSSSGRIGCSVWWLVCWSFYFEGIHSILLDGWSEERWSYMEDLTWRMGGGGPGSEGGGDHEGREVSGVRKSWKVLCWSRTRLGLLLLQFCAACLRANFLYTWCTSDTLMTEPSCVNVSIPGRGMEERCAGESGREGGWELVQLLVRWWWAEEEVQEMLSRSGR